MSMKTEDEASLCWCPFVRQSATIDRSGFSFNRNTHSPGLAAPCIASDCMSWRWEPLLADDRFAAAVKAAAEELGDTSPGRHKAAKHVIANRAAYGLPEKPFRGWCGLASKPEPLS